MNCGGVLTRSGLEMAPSLAGCAVKTTGELITGDEPMASGTARPIGIEAGIDGG